MAGVDPQDNSWSQPEMPPPGWYPDAAGVVRWWDGQRWGDPPTATGGKPTSWRRRAGVALGILALMVVSAAGFWSYINHDHVDFIDDPTVADQASKACDELEAQLGQIATDGQSDDRAAAEGGAVMAMVASIRSLGDDTIDGDAPTEQWLEDWEALAASHAAGLTVPLDDAGNSITDRMNELAVDSSIPECLVPLQLVSD